MKNYKENFLLGLYIIFGKHLPESRHFSLGKRIRVFFARLIMEKVGENINVEKGAVFGSKVSLGSHSGIGVDCQLYGPVKIGEYVNMGPEVIVYTQNHRFDKTDIPMQFQGYSGINPVVIEDDVWLGRRVIILPGVRIGKGSVIGAGSVLAKSVPEYSVVVGNPARVIKHRK